jgi:AcrR family transcriptional regulator
MGILERRKREKDRRRKEIESAAKTVFFKKGYQAATIEEIARVCELSKSTLYVYYNSKDELYVYLMMSAVEELGRSLEYLEGMVAKKKYKSGSEVIMQFFKIYWKLYGQYSDEIRIIQAFQNGNYFSSLSSEMLKKINGPGKRNYETSRRIISKCLDLGLMKNVDVNSLCDVLWGLFLGIVQIEESKLRVTNKDHLFGTLKFSFELISRSFHFNEKTS